MRVADPLHGGRILVLHFSADCCTTLRGGPGGSRGAVGELLTWRFDSRGAWAGPQAATRLQNTNSSSIFLDPPWQGCHWRWIPGQQVDPHQQAADPPHHHHGGSHEERRGCEGWDEANAGTPGRLLFMADRRDNLRAVKKLSQKLSSQFISTRARS